jgi:hypothetical protein
LSRWLNASRVEALPTVTAIADIRRGALASLIPPERLPLSEWIERNVVVPQGTFVAAWRGWCGCTCVGAYTAARGHTSGITRCLLTSAVSTDPRWPMPLSSIPVQCGRGRQVRPEGAVSAFSLRKKRYGSLLV